MISNNLKFAALYLLGQGYTQQRVSEKFGVSQQTVAKWLKAKDKIRAQNRQDLIEHVEKVLLGEETWQTMDTTT